MKLSHILIGLILILLLVGGVQAAAWYNPSWVYRKSITITYTQVPNTDQLNFPVLINLTTDNDLKNNARSDGFDILFTNSTGTDKIPYERERYTSSTGALVAWVNVTNLSHTADTILYMYYGNSGVSDQQDATHVWDSNFKGVWHLPNGTTLSVLDSTSNANNGTNNVATAVTGKIDGSANFDGTTAYISVLKTQFTPLPTSTYSIEVWMQDDTAFSLLGTFHRMVSWADSTTATNLQFGLGQGNANPNRMFYLTYGSANALAMTSGTIATGWNHAVITHSGSTYLMYVNGTLRSQDAYTRNDIVLFAATSLYIGQRGNGAGVVGYLDEIRISDIARSADWIKTEYNNQNSPSTFYAVGAQVVAPTFTSITPASGNTGGGTPVTIVGTGFVAGASLGVTIGGNAATGVSRTDATHIAATTPAGTAGAARDVVITNGDGGTVTGTGAYTYVGPPTFTSITPASGNTGGGTPVTIVGTGFVAGASLGVTIGGNAATGVSRTDATHIAATTPAGTAGAARDVVITNGDGGTVTGTGAYTYVGPPTVSARATDVGGTKVLVTFDKNMFTLPAAPAGFTVTVNGGGDVVSAVALNGGDNKIVELTLTTPVASSLDTVLVTYAPGTVKSADGGVLAGFGPSAVTNAMPAPAPSPPPDNGGSDGGGSDGPSPASAPASLAMLAPAEETSSTSEVNVGGNSAVTQVAVTGTGISDVIVTGTVVSGPGQDNAPPVGNVYEYMDITPARYTTIDNAVISFTVPVWWLEEHHLTPQDIIMNHQAGKTWNALPTTLVKIKNGQAYYTAVSPRFSRFAITGEINPAGAVQEQTPNNQTLSDMVQATTAPVVSTVAHTPIATQTTAAPPAQPAIQPSFGFPVMIIGVVGIIILIGLALLIRRWWIRRQNPALFRKYG
jgi:PGF-pre-PGF domain-containing protein